MKDYEFRCLEEFLKKSGVECRCFMDKSKVEALRNSGAELLFDSFFGQNLFTGEAGTIVLSRNPADIPPSAALIHAARKFDEELVKREKTRSEGEEE